LIDCLFCKIARSEIPAQMVYQDDGFVAFRDTNPQAPTHILVIPRQHIPTLNQALDNLLLGKLMVRVRDVARKEGLGERGYRVVINTNEEAGQTVFHLHAHVLGGRQMQWPPG
jgi:histidine triad (HIT) family protein